MNNPICVYDFSLKDQWSTFIETKAYKRFEEFAIACRTYKYIGLCYGKPGVGKTLSAQYFAKWHDIEHIHKKETIDEATQKAIQDCKAVYYSAQIVDSPKGISDRIYRYLSQYGSAALRLQGITDWETLLVGAANHCPLVILDEADGLAHRTLEQLRALFDQYHFGLILIGMPGFEKRLARYPQLFSRIGFAHEFKPLSQDEMEFIFEQHWQKLGVKLDLKQFSQVEAMKTIARMTNGNFRLIQRIFEQIKRLQQVNNITTINTDLVMAARDCLVMV